jgi:hypothetical protein
MLKSTAAAGALAVSLATIASMTSPSGATAVTAAPKASAMINAQVVSVAKATHLTPTQVANARTIVSVVEAQKLPRRAAVIAVATAMTESRLRNHHYGDRDSEGLFQQRPSQGWGTAKQVVNPQHATRRFLDALQRVPDWRSRPLTVDAQAVQRSAFPTAYARWEPLADKLVNALLPPAGPAKAPTRTPTAPPDALGAVPTKGCTVRLARKRVSTRP